MTVSPSAPPDLFLQDSAASGTSPSAPILALSASKGHHMAQRSLSTRGQPENPVATSSTSMGIGPRTTRTAGKSLARPRWSTRASSRPMGTSGAGPTR
jgi:hypothetical protein